MKCFLNSFLFFLPILFYPTVSFSQTNSKIDSLENVLKKSDDTSKVNLLNALALEYRKSSPSTALAHLSQALILSEKNDFQKGKGNTYSTMGAVYFDLGNYERALKFYSKSLTIWEDVEDKKGIANNLKNIGDVNINLGNYETALKNYLKALEIYEFLGDKKPMPLNNIAASYFYLGNYEKALDYYFRALKTFEALDRKSVV